MILKSKGFSAVLFLLMSFVVLAPLMCAPAYVWSIDQGRSNWSKKSPRPYIKERLNVDGDVELSAEEDRYYWNPHSCGYSEDVNWDITFTDKVLISLSTPYGESGHLATGMWWTAGFVGKEKIPLWDTTFYRPKTILVDFDAKVNEFVHNNGWLRIGFAAAIYRNGQVLYTEMDIKCSPAINVTDGIVYAGGNVVEYKIDDIRLNKSKSYHVVVTDYIQDAWGIQPGDLLESVYIEVESDGVPVEVEMELDNLWIRN